MSEFDKDYMTTEELKELDGKMKKVENIRLPQSLEAENIEKLLDENTMHPPKKGVRKKSHKKQITAFLSAAAVFAVAVVGAFAVKTRNDRVENPVKVPSAASGDYTEIEKMFRGYSKKYNSFGSQFRDTFDAVFNGVPKDTATIIDSVEDTSKNPGGFGKTNEQVKGVSEADILKNDGKYLYSIALQNADWETFYDKLDRYSAYLGGDDDSELNKETKPYDSGEDDVQKRITDNSYKVQTAFPTLEYTCAVTITEPLPDGSFRHISTVNVAAEDNVYHMDIREMYVGGNKLILLVDCTATDGVSTEAVRDVYYGYTDSGILTMAVCFDISDVKNPKEMWRTYQDGEYVSSRLIDQQLVVMSTYGVDISKDEDEVVENCVPLFGSSANQLCRIGCDCICIMPEVYDTRYLVASTLDVNDVASLKTQAVLGAGEDVYSTPQTLYVVGSEYENNDTIENVFGYTKTKTQILKFDIRNADIKFLCSGSVDGTTHNQFSIDEYNGYLRIATTTDIWNEKPTNQLYVLDENLAVVGEITDIAPGETIKSVRFSGDTGYVVTFEQTDPLFAVDLSEPKNPRIAGEVKISGFSSYLHPVGDSLLLGVGEDGDEDGTNGGLKVSLFDVSDPQKPVECDRVVVPEMSAGEKKYAYLTCEAYYSHKALCWDAENSVMYIPYTETVGTYSDEDFDELQYGNILAIKVDEKNKSLVEENRCKIKTSDGQNYGVLGRVTYIDDTVIGYVQEQNAFYSFDKDGNKYLNKIRIG